MASIGISEFSFGFAFLHEQTLLHGSSLAGAPVLPSLQQETLEGWDANLPRHGVDFYYQFKLSEYMYRSNAKFMNEDPNYRSPYYKIEFLKKHYNRQHRRLRAHSESHPWTYYAAPEFQDVIDFNRLFLSGSLTSSTRLFPVAFCDDVQIDNMQHYITFLPGDPNWHQHSKPMRKEGSIFGRDLATLYESSKRDWKPIDREFAARLYARALKTVETMHREEEQEENREEDHEGNEEGRRKLVLPGIEDWEDAGQILLKASRILSAHLGIAMVLVGERPSGR